MTKIEKNAHLFQMGMAIQKIISTHWFMENTYPAQPILVKLA